MTTILILNAVSSLLASAGVGGLLLLRARWARPAAMTHPAYVASRTDRQDAPNPARLPFAEWRRLERGVRAQHLFQQAGVGVGVGDPGLEPGTSSLSEKRSNQLS